MFLLKPSFEDLCLALQQFDPSLVLDHFCQMCLSSDHLWSILSNDSHHVLLYYCVSLLVVVKKLFWWCDSVLRCIYCWLVAPLAFSTIILPLLTQSACFSLAALTLSLISSKPQHQHCYAFFLLSVDLDVYVDLVFQSYLLLMCLHHHLYLSDITICNWSNDSLWRLSLLMVCRTQVCTI